DMSRNLCRNLYFHSPIFLKKSKHDLIPIQKSIVSLYHISLFSSITKLFILFENQIQTTSALSATSKQCFEQPAVSFLVCTLIFIEYYSQAPSPFFKKISRLIGRLYFL
ncbi:hypothetical protein MK484_04995, partial [Streptococcus mitis]|nr:hypothetical protein [Streptococcus mitis]